MNPQIHPIVRDPNEPRKPVHVPIYPSQEEPKQKYISSRQRDPDTKTGGDIRFDSRNDNIITALIAFGGLHHDKQDRLFVSGTGFPHVCRIDIDRLDRDQLKEIASVYATQIEDSFTLKSFIHAEENYNYITTCDSRAQKLATTVQEVLKERRFKRPIYVVPLQTPPRGRTFIVVDAIRTGYTLAHALRELTRQKADVKHVCSLFNYEYGGEETLNEAECALGISPKHHFMIQRKDYEWFIRKHAAGGEAAEHMIALIWNYQTGPIQFCVNRFHSKMCEGKKWHPNDMVIPVNTGADASEEAARAGLERAILRLSVETACYPCEQSIWNYKEKVEHQSVLLTKMAEIRKAYLEKYGDAAAYWMAALEPMVGAAQVDAQGRGYSLNGAQPNHTRNVRKFFTVLREHHPKIPYNIFGLLDLDKFKRGTDAYNAP